MSAHEHPCEVDLAGGKPRNRREPARELLELMTGAWKTQALAVAARLRVADHLARDGAAPAPAVPLTLAALAERVGAHEDGLRRLLGFLASIGVVRANGDVYALTELGELLREDARHSLRPLAMLYGGPFYQSFGSLEHSVRTGEDGFRHAFGAHHFDHFAQQPELADLFDRAMAASSSMFRTLNEHFDFAAARVVVDIAGGNGELLAQILGKAPHVRGVLFERAHAVDAARAHLAKAGCAERCDFVVGNFLEALPAGGDVYLLSRVMHDWDDATCLAILRGCAAAMPDHADLLLVERILPADGRASLAVAWDLHMLCNVGGRERTQERYRQLLRETGFEHVSTHALPLDFHLLRARKSRAPR